MFNDLIGKNKELGRFLFCERYTLPPVKNAMYIAEGQDLKRGAVVDVNGVLVGTNSLMPYAVLEFDCDTSDGGKEASVFINGEFNFDKLSFADGLSKDDMDNIVYNGSGIGIVIKPYAFDKEFSPQLQLSSNIAPNYTKTTYPANSYVMQDGVLYTNPNTIVTAEDWNPAHWTQTTVVEMMAGTSPKWVKRTASLTINGGATEQINVQDHEVLDLKVNKGTGPGAGDLSMHLYGECYVLLDKSYNIRVATLIGDSNTNTTDVNPGLVTLNSDVVTAIAPEGSGIPEEYSQDNFNTIGVLSNDTSIYMADSSPAWASPMNAVLHFLGEGTLVITPLAN